MREDLHKQRDRYAGRADVNPYAASSLKDIQAKIDTFEQAAEAVVVTDSGARVVSVNRAAAALFELEPGSAAGTELDARVRVDAQPVRTGAAARLGQQRPAAARDRVVEGDHEVTCGGRMQAAGDVLAGRQEVGQRDGAEIVAERGADARRRGLQGADARRHRNRQNITF